MVMMGTIFVHLTARLAHGPAIHTLFAILTAVSNKANTVWRELSAEPRTRVHERLSGCGLANVAIF